MAWNRVAVVGAGLIKMGELFEQSYEQMAAGAFDAAVQSVDKGFEPAQVEAAFVATQRGTLWGQEAATRSRLRSVSPASRARGSRTPAHRVPTRSGSARWRSRAASTTSCW
jgi:acetyl-CoA acetyltransferase